MLEAPRGSGVGEELNPEEEEAETGNDEKDADLEGLDDDLGTMLREMDDVDVPAHLSMVREPTEGAGGEPAAAVPRRGAAEEDDRMPPPRRRQQVAAYTDLGECAQHPVVLVNLTNFSANDRTVNAGAVVAEVVQQEPLNRAQRRAGASVAALTKEMLERELESDRPRETTEVTDAMIDEHVATNDRLNAEQKASLAQLVKKWRDRCLISGGAHPRIGTFKGVFHRIRTGSRRPKPGYRKREPPLVDKVIDKFNTELVEDEVVEPSTSSFRAPVVLARKKGGKIRFCVDFRALNEVTEFDAYPSPNVETHLDALAGSPWVSVMDLNSGYHQILIHPDDRHKTAFGTSTGLWQWKRMPFGLVSAPATFIRAMESILRTVGSDRVLGYVDDVVCFSPTWRQHLKDLDDVFQAFHNAGATILLEKCDFARSEVEFLGHTVIPGVGCRPQAEKIQAIDDWAVPGDAVRLRSFLSTAGFYRKYIKNFARIAKPLFALTRKGAKWEWSLESHGVAFAQLKAALVSKPILHFPNFELPFRVRVDASKDGIGATLMNVMPDGEELTVAYASWALSKHEKNYGLPELEGLGIRKSTDRWRPYLFGSHFDIHTDHWSNQYLVDGRQTKNARLERWAMWLQQFDYSIVYRKGVHMGDADGLSRSRPSGETADHSESESDDDGQNPPKDSEARGQKRPRLGKRIDWGVAAATKNGTGGATPATDPSQRGFLERVAESQERDPMVCQARGRACAGRRAARGEVSVGDDDILRWRFDVESPWRVWLPADMRDGVVRSGHDNLEGAHLGSKKTFARLRRSYFWPAMRDDIERYVGSCVQCLARKSKRRPEGFQQPVRVDNVRETVGMDLVKFPTTKEGYQYALVMVDHLSKFGVAVALKSKKAVSVAKAFVERWCLPLGRPDRILTDRGGEFVNALLEEVNKLFGTGHAKTAPYRPQSDGLVENRNRTLEQMLSHYVSSDQKDWVKYLDYVVHAYNTAVHEATGYTPFFLEFGKEEKPIELAGQVVEMKGGAKEWRRARLDVITGLNKAREAARDRNRRAQDRSKERHDRGRVEAAIDIDDWVMVRKPALERDLGTLTTKLAKDGKLARVLRRTETKTVFLVEFEDGTVSAENVANLMLAPPRERGELGRHATTPEHLQEGAGSEGVSEFQEVHRVINAREETDGWSYLLVFKNHCRRSNAWVRDVSFCKELVDQFWKSERGRTMAAERLAATRPRSATRNAKGPGGSARARKGGAKRVVKSILDERKVGPVVSLQVLFDDGGLQWMGYSDLQRCQEVTGQGQALKQWSAARRRLRSQRRGGS